MLEVIGAGYSRTGTTSLKRALEIIGIGRCYHFTEMLRRRHTARWLAILDGEPPGWDDLFTGYSATVDWPSVAYYRELADYYPDAKVVLTVRDPDAWHASLTRALIPLRRVLPPWIPWASKVGRLTDRLIWNGTFRGRAEERHFAVEIFDRHIREVRDAIHCGRLLVFDVKDGWEPLCKFLDRPVPAVPFPNTNSYASIRTAVWAIRILKWLIVVAFAVAAVGLLALPGTWR